VLTQKSVSVRFATLASPPSLIFLDSSQPFASISSNASKNAAAQSWRAKCSKCGGKRVDVRPNWKEKAGSTDSWQGRSAWEK
jgi:hypothetical protein